MKYTLMPLIATLSLLAACGSDSTAPANNGTVSGTVSFTYTGGGGGSYSATGAIGSSVTSLTTNTGTWAVGWRNNTDNSTNVVSNVAKAGGLADQAVVQVNGQTTGAATIVSSCSTTSTASCTDVILLLGVNASSTSWTYICTLESGTVTITSISSTNATGTFSGTGTCISAALASSVFTVTSGSFNVPLLANVPT